MERGVQYPLSPALMLAIALVGVAGLALLVMGLCRLRRRKPISGGGLGLSGAALLVLALFAAALLANLYTYRRFTHEQPLAELEFTHLGEYAYRVRLHEPAGSVRSFELRGDQWQLDARIMKWHGVATLAGLDPLYRLERLNGRYRDVVLERSAPRSVYGLAAHAGLDLWLMAQRHGRWLPWLDASYGNATYMPMAPGARYEVRITASGLIARPLNPAARAALADWR